MDVFELRNRADRRLPRVRHSFMRIRDERIRERVDEALDEGSSGRSRRSA